MNDKQKHSHYENYSTKVLTVMGIEAIYWICGNCGLFRKTKTITFDNLEKYKQLGWKEVKN